MNCRARPVALAIIRRGPAILLIDLAEASTGRRFYRPAGGGIEFGERGIEAVIREIREELGVECTVARFAGVLENIFTYNGVDEHEILMCYDVLVADETWNRQDVIHGSEDDGSTFTCRWVTFEQARQEGRPVYPDGLEALIAGLGEGD